MSDFPTEILDQVASAAAPLHPADRDGFIDACLIRMRSEVEIGPGTANRIVRELLALGTYRRDAATIVTADHASSHAARCKPVKGDVAWYVSARCVLGPAAIDYVGGIADNAITQRVCSQGGVPVRQRIVDDATHEGDERLERCLTVRRRWIELTDCKRRRQAA
jgi:hypothetical protein